MHALCTDKHHALALSEHRIYHHLLSEISSSTHTSEDSLEIDQNTQQFPRDQPRAVCNDSTCSSAKLPFTELNLSSLNTCYSFPKVIHPT